MEDTITLPYQWSPRPYQKGVWDYLSKGGKRAVTNWHRRAGKDEVYLHHTQCAAYERVGNYWYMLPESAQAKKAVWNAVDGHTGERRIDRCFPKALRKKTLEDEMFIQWRNGSTLQLVGSDNFNSLLGSPPVGLVFSEYAVSNPAAWAYLMPILEENGGWAAFNSTPRGKNHFKSLADFSKREPGWFYSQVDASESGVFTEEQLGRILRELQAKYGEAAGESFFNQEYFCSFDAALPGSIWGEALSRLMAQGRLTTGGSLVSVPHIPGVPVFTGWDLGYDDATVCWFYQIINKEIHVIDYLENNFKDVEFYANRLKERAEQGYVYGTHWFPHDAKPKTLAGGGKSILTQFHEYNRDHKGILGGFRIAPKLSPQDGIQAARATLPFCRFDSEKTEVGTEHLKSYMREWNEETQDFSQKPKHDASSHASDAWRTVGTTWRLERTSVIEEETPYQPPSNVISLMNFGELKQRHFAAKREKEGLYL